MADSKSGRIRDAAKFSSEPAKIVSILKGWNVTVTKNLVRQVLKNGRRKVAAATKEKVNRSSEIRSLLADGLKPVVIKKTLASRGIEVSDNLIDTVVNAG